jgi:prophage antirepressor-like protein
MSKSKKLSRIIDDLEEHFIMFEDFKIIVILDNDDKLWMSGSDVALSLDYKYPKDAIQNNVENEDKLKLENINTNIKINKHPHSIFINESGLYSLIISSTRPKAKKFKKWITSDVLPSIREFGYYRMKEQKNKEINKLMNNLTKLKKELDDAKNDLKVDKYPRGAMFYVVDYSEDDEEIYRIGITTDMKKRKQIYDTHMLHKRKVIFPQEPKNPSQFEMCVRSLLFEYRYKNNKDFFKCDKEIVKKAISTCKKSINSIIQKGGGNELFDKYNNEIKNVKKQINKNKKELKNATIIFRNFQQKPDA